MAEQNLHQQIAFGLSYCILAMVAVDAAVNSVSVQQGKTTLNGMDLKQSSAVDWKRCLRQCIRNDQCAAFNYNATDSQQCSLFANKDPHPMEVGDPSVYYGYMPGRVGVPSCLSNPCGNGTCTDKMDGSVLCSCAPYFLGDMCEIEVPMSRGFVILGGTRGLRTDAILEFNPFYDSVTTATQSLSSERYHHNAALYDGKIIVDGGEEQTWRAIMEIYDLDTLALTTTVSGSVGRSATICAGVSSGKYYVCFGKDLSYSLYNHCDVYDLENSYAHTVWVPLPLVNGGMEQMRCEFTDDHMYIIGGYMTQENGVHVGNLNRLTRVNLHNGTITQLADYAFRFKNMYSVWYLGDILVCGGEKKEGGSNNIYVNDCNRYLVSEDRWVSFPPMTSTRGYHVMATLYDRVYAFGGEDHNHQALKSVEVYMPQVGHWQYVTDLPNKLNRMAIVNPMAHV